MAIFKCKICGEPLDPSKSVVTCEYCGTKQTMPRLGDERRANLYDRANHFRRNNDFDKAMAIYETILNEDLTDAEAYWSIVLCRYGIEYVKDPATRRHVPTVNRAQYTSIFDDEDYKSAIANADDHQREVYEAEAAAINEIQKGILAISQKESPFDVFICYKETDANGRRTHDSVLAQELYYQLKQEGFKVFFSRITLEDKLGSAYEPYIFAALNSAKVMVVLGTAPEHFNAVWVRNEWSRYLSLIKNGAKKVLIPAYRDMDPYDLPEEFSHLQAQDMSKLGFMQDLVRGIRKIIGSQTPKAAAPVKETIIETAAAVNVTALLRRVFLFLEDGEFDNANEYCEKVLDQDPENAQAYLGKLMVDLRVKKQEELATNTKSFEDNANYQKVVRFGDPALATTLKEYLATIRERNTKKAEENRKETLYLKAINDYESQDIPRLQNAVDEFASLDGYKDSAERVRLCRAKIDQIRIKEENDRIERERLEEETRGIEARRVKRNLVISFLIAALIVCIVTPFIIYYNTVTVPKIEGLVFKEVGNTYHLTAYNGQDSTVIIPAKVNEKPVTTIEAYTFRNCSKLQSVTIPSSITSIGEYSFQGCTALTNVEIPNSVTSIGHYAFANCTKLEKMTLPFVGATLNGTENTYFGYIFGSSSNHSVPSSLKNVVITGGTEIGDGAFCGCSDLESIAIPPSVTTIGDEAFTDCTGLTGVYITDLEAWCKISFELYASEFGYSNPLAYANNLYLNGVLLTSLKIPNSITSINNGAFQGCKSLTSVTIPASVTNIGSYAFEGCTGLTNITIPSSVTSIGYWAFGRCTNLTKVVFQNCIGWSCSFFDSYSIESSSLENSATAATYLTDIYVVYYWRRK